MTAQINDTFRYRKRVTGSIAGTAQVQRVNGDMVGAGQFAGERVDYSRQPTCSVIGFRRDQQDCRVDLFRGDRLFRKVSLLWQAALMQRQACASELHFKLIDRREQAKEIEGDIERLRVPPHSHG
jgi:hypothetical protein